MKQKLQPTNESLSNIVTPLLAWYENHARILPWRSNPIPYHVWVSEIMLQQTRVEAVLPYFQRFIAALPSVSALACADDEVLLKLWEGLGYYSRVRNLKKAAQVVVQEYHGALPASEQELRKLPGIGEYTAGAIASIAFGIPAPAVDGNVLRVVTRLLEDTSDITNTAFKKTVSDWIRDIIPPTMPGEFTQALMEIGATICLPNGAPLCDSCPLGHLCQANQSGTQMTLPRKAEKKPRRIEKKTMLILVSDHGRVALRKRAEKGLLSGLWELPNLVGYANQSQVAQQLTAWQLSGCEIKQLEQKKHIFTHIEWRMRYYMIQVRQESDAFVWISEQDLCEGYALPGAFKGYYDLMVDTLRQYTS